MNRYSGPNIDLALERASTHLQIPAENLRYTLVSFDPDKNPDQYTIRVDSKISAEDEENIGQALIQNILDDVIPPGIYNISEGAPRFDLVSFSVADKLFEGALEKWIYCSSEVLLIHGDVVIAGNFNGCEDLGVDRGSQWGGDDALLIAITGSLVVSERIRFMDHDPGLFVKGRTQSGSVECGDSEVILMGPAKVRTFVLGEYSDGHMQVSASVPLVISNRQHEIGVSAPHALYIENDGGCENYDYLSEQLDENFVAEVLKDGHINFDALYHCIEAGDSIFLNSPSFETEKIRLTKLKA